MPAVRHNEAESRYELETPHGLATAAYQASDGVLAFTHTHVPDADQGHGVGGALIAGALADVRARGARVLPLCPFVADYLEHHAEARDLVADG